MKQWLLALALVPAGAMGQTIVNLDDLRQEAAHGVLLQGARDNAAFAKGHIPGAVNIGDATLTLRNTFTEDYLPTPNNENLLGAAGIDPARKIVVYGLRQKSLTANRTGETKMDEGGRSQEKPASKSSQQLPKNKQTSLGLYATAQEAYEMWKADPDRVKIIDVRTPEEYAFVGHPEKAWNIPVAFVTYRREHGTTKYGPKMNPDFVAEVKKIAGPTDILLLMCRSGDRSAMAVNQLAAAGLKKAYTITDGFEGDKVDDPGSVFHGKRMRNGWKNSAPWVYTIDPEKIILEEGSSKQTQ